MDAIEQGRMFIERSHHEREEVPSILQLTV